MDFLGLGMVRRSRLANNKSHQCHFPDCDRTFFQKGHLRRHQREKHGGRKVEGLGWAFEDMAGGKVDFSETEKQWMGGDGGMCAQGFGDQCLGDTCTEQKELE